MRLNLILPKVEPTVFEYPKKCPRKGCPGMRFIPRQEVCKKIVDAQHPEVTAWLEPILDAVDADVVVSDETGRSQQVCKSHVVRNTEALVEELSAMIIAGQDHSLDAIGTPPEQALEDLASLKEMIHSRRPEDQSRLEEIYLRYANARKPGRGHKHEVAYRMRNLFMDRWNLWPRLSFYRDWKDEYGNEILDGTNNHCQRAIGCWIKERYRPMRGYKQVQSALAMSRLIALARNHLSRGLHLAVLMA